MHFVRLTSILIILVLIVPAAQATKEDDWQYIAHPGNIPLFANFTTPQMIPGHTGKLNFTLTNRYDKPITDVNLTLEIYRYANIHESKNLSETEKPPYFVITHSQKTFKVWNQINPKEKKTDAVFYIRSREDTEQGTYFVRMMLTFAYNGSQFIMKSRGYFTKAQWDDATTNTTENDPGNINITKLGVDGIIPDTTFGVKKPWPLWPMYALGALTVLFAVLAILDYMYEENTNPEFTHWVHKQQRRLGEYRTLLLHELEKFKKKKET